LALHFDLTVPLARYVVQNYSLLSFPFRRYQIQKVWRGERPQSGRYREFYQCDIDVVGDKDLPLLVDAEMPSVIYQIFKQMDIGKFMIGVNNRKILQGYFSFYGLTNHCINEAMHAVDKLEKVGVDKTRETMNHPEPKIKRRMPDKIRKANARYLVSSLSIKSTHNVIS